MDEKDQIKKLEEFIVDNRDLEELENRLSQFNIFEAIGAVRQELRHSDFLAFIMDPSRNHGLGDIVLKKILKDVVTQSDNSPISAIDLDVNDMEAVDVRREWQSIDILIIDDNNKLVIAIENKIDSDEGDNQLQKYSKRLDDHFLGYDKLNIYLTPIGEVPSCVTYHQKYTSSSH